MNKPSTVQKVTTRGQITLPKKWRDQYVGSIVQVEQKKDTLVIKPATVVEDELVWSAARDRDGKGLSADEFVAILDTIIESS